VAVILLVLLLLYQLGKIYKIVCNETGEQYIGATCQKKLCTRLAQHVSIKNTITSRSIIERGNYEICLIESFPCESKDQLHQRERYFIETLECVNKNIPTRTQKGWRQDNKEHILAYKKNYNADNKEQISKYQKEWYADNKDQISKYQKEWYADNKDKMEEYHMDYRQKNKDKIQQYKKEYAQKNRDIINQKQRDRYQAKKQTPVEHREQRREYWANLKESQKVSLSPIE